jgi:lysozyme family protein
MKSTKYQRLQDEYNHALDQLRIHREVIDKLVVENRRLKSIEKAYEYAIEEDQQTKEGLLGVIAEKESDIEFYSEWWDYFAKAHAKAFDETVELKAEIERLKKGESE